MKRSGQLSDGPPGDDPTRKAWKELVRETNELKLTDALCRLRDLARLASPEDHLTTWASAALGLKDAELQKWWERAWWGRAAAYAVGRRLQRAREDEVQAMISPPDFSQLTSLLGRGRGMVVVGAHLGPRLVAHYSLRWAGFPVRAFTGTDKMRRRFGDDILNMAEPSEQGVSLARAALSLRSGHQLYLLADGRGGSQSIETSLFGQPVAVRRGPPALILGTQVPSIPVAAVWDGHRIRLDVGEPLPGSGEGVIVTEEDWVTSYMKWYTSVASVPENLRLGGGLWRPNSRGVL